MKTVEETSIIPQGQGEIVVYQPDESISLEVRLENETVWLTQQQMAQLFATTKQNISLHIGNIFREGELQREMVVKNSFTTTQHGAMPGKTQRMKVVLYNLDVIISVGYRVKSPVGTRFRQWANAVIKQYLLSGYAVHSHLVVMQQQIDSRFASIEDKMSRQQSQIDFIVRTNQPPKELLIPTGCVWDAWNFMSELIRNAEQRIVLVDNYVDERTLSILDKRKTGVGCMVHTRYNMQAQLDFEKHNAQCAPIACVQLPQAVHDRYLIVDDAVWLLGASVKDMGRGLCTIIRIGFKPEEILARL